LHNATGTGETIQSDCPTSLLPKTEEKSKHRTGFEKIWAMRRTSENGFPKSFSYLQRFPLSMHLKEETVCTQQL